MCAFFVLDRPLHHNVVRYVVALELKWLSLRLSTVEPFVLRECVSGILMRLHFSFLRPAACGTSIVSHRSCTLCSVDNCASPQSNILELSQSMSVCRFTEITDGNIGRGEPEEGVS